MPEPGLPLSLSMIVRDEEAVLGRVLGDISGLCSELVVVDTGSTDRTVEIARQFGAAVYEFPWVDDFSAARNFSLAQCHEDWVVWLDADDRLPPKALEGLRRIHELAVGRGDVDAVALPYRYDWAPNDPDLCTVSLNTIRLFRNGIGLEWHGVVHERLRRSGNAPFQVLCTEEAWVDHRPLAGHFSRTKSRNLHLLQQAVRNGDRSPETLRSLGREEIRRQHFADAVPLLREAIAGFSESDLDLRYDALVELSDCAAQLKDGSARLESLLQAVGLNSTRAEALIKLGFIYYEQERWYEAMPYFAAATVLKRPVASGGNLNDTAYSWLPWDCLSVCASKIGDYAAANEYALHALTDNPEYERVLSNVRFNLEQLSKRPPE